MMTHLAWLDWTIFSSHLLHCPICTYFFQPRGVKTWRCTHTQLFCTFKFSASRNSYAGWVLYFLSVTIVWTRTIFYANSCAFFPSLMTISHQRITDIYQYFHQSTMTSPTSWGELNINSFFEIGSRLRNRILCYFHFRTNKWLANLLKWNNCTHNFKIWRQFAISFCMSILQMLFISLISLFEPCYLLELNLWQYVQMFSLVAQNVDVAMLY
jgi:hypothetical protein